MTDVRDGAGTEQDTIDGEDYHVAECRDCQTSRQFDAGEDGFSKMMDWAGGHISERYDSPCENVRTKAVWPDGGEAYV